MARPPAEHLDEPLARYLRRDIVPLNIEQTVGDALTFLRRQPIGERVIYFYVTDREGHLAGVIPTRRLLTADPGTPVRSLMVTRLASLPIDGTVRQACEAFRDDRYLALPVVDSSGVLQGVVDVGLFTDEIEQLIERRELDDVFQLIGVHVADTVGPWEAFRARVPWLMFNVFGGIAAALLAGLYESLLDAVVVLALFIPVVLALAESVSMQSVTLTLQALHRVQPDWPGVRRALRREMTTALLLGTACGSIVGAVAWAWKGVPVVGAGIAIVITVSMVTASLLGVALPTGLRALRQDPRLASGPIVLATADLLTLLLYFNLAGLLLE